jgi:hypothetical protein
VKSGSCGCPNLATIRDDKISAVDMSQVVLLSAQQQRSYNSFFTPSELADQEARRKRGVRKLEFEVR